MKTLYKGKVKEVVIPQALRHNGTSQDKWNEVLKVSSDFIIHQVLGKLERQHLGFVLAGGWIFQEQVLYGPKYVSMYSAEYVAALRSRKNGWISPDTGYVNDTAGPNPAKSSESADCN
jgi:hypothetical protein